ncbi:MAG: hypothetical protein AB7S80_14875 [Rhizobiaceae bacterium]
MRLRRVTFCLALVFGVAIPQIPLLGLAASASEALRAPHTPQIEQCHRLPA